MRKIGYWTMDARRFSGVILLHCGELVDKPVNCFGINKKSYSQFPQTIFFKVKNQKVIQKLHTSYKHFLHTKFIRFLSVDISFYTISTGPTITTKYILKKGLY